MKLTQLLEKRRSRLVSSNRITTIVLPFFLAVSLSACSQAAKETETTSVNQNNNQPLVEESNQIKTSLPNIVFILSDDHSWNDYSFMGHEIIQTPNLDQLAEEGVTFKRGYIPTSLCRPSLATIATGLYAYQHGITGNDPSRNLPGGRKGEEYHAQRAEIIAKIDEVETLPEILRDYGYKSLQTGKWWEGNYKRGGFDEGMTRGFPEQGGRHGDDGLKIGREGMDVITDFIDKSVANNDPFFVWYAPFLPHSPHTPPERIYKKYSGLGLPEPVAKYYAMVEWFDETNGQLLDHLDKAGVKDNTLVVYIADNGWISNPEQLDRFLSGSKQSPDDGGVRTPIMFSLPSQLAPQMRSELVSSIDLVPTVLGAVGIDVPDTLPGLNLFDNMEQQTPIARDTIFGEGYAHDMDELDNPESTLMYRWVIDGQWKLILSYDGKNISYKKHHEGVLGAPRLYNIVDDQFEKNNLAEKYPEKLKELADKLVTWYPLKERKILN